MALAAVGLVACSASDPRPAIPTTPGTSAPAPSTPSPTASNGLQSIPEIEAQARVAWSRYWKTYLALQTSYPPGRWKAIVEAIAVNPVKDQILLEASRGRVEGTVGYGFIVSHVFWPAPPLPGARSVLLGDCFDGTHAGSKVMRSGTIRSHGVKRTHVHAFLDRGADGAWRVRQIIYLTKTPC